MAKVKLRLVAAQVAGVWALSYYVSWWICERRYSSPFQFILLALGLLFIGAQLVGSWLFFWLAGRRLAAPRRSHNFTVDVFVTTCGEPLSLVEPALRAALALEGPHRTYLLDDGPDPACAQLCEHLGAGYFTRPDRAEAKAGNLNAALPRTSGEIVVIFDVDHVPCQAFLTETVHHFLDPHVGFVQVMLSFSNNDQTWLARGATETSYEWYNPISLGMDAIGGASLMGSNALIRRTALESIGGYHSGLAEDLATSLALHAAGWRSAYVAQPLAPGLAPASLLAWYDQQLKWARGVFEVLLAAYPRALSRLSWKMRLAYLVRLTKYWIGPAVLLHMLMSGGVLFAPASTRALVQDYFVHLAPLVLADLWIRGEALRQYRHPSVPSAFPMRALLLIYFTWPVYSLAWIMALLRLPLAFRPTPKDPGGGLNPAWMLPQSFACLGLIAGLVVALSDNGGQPVHFLIALVALQTALQLWLILFWLRRRSPLSSEPIPTPSSRATLLDV